MDFHVFILFFFETIEFYIITKLYNVGARATIFTAVNLALRDGVVPLHVTKGKKSNFAQDGA